MLLCGYVLGKKVIKMAEIVEKSLNFIEEIVENDLETGKHKTVTTRFPPEPNGYLHIGHAKSICLNFGLAQRFGGKTNLRFDDTNPTKEDIEYVDSIREDVKWLIEEMPMAWSEERYASDYFQTIYDLTIMLIQKGLAYVDHSTAEEMATLKGTPTQAGKNSPYRDRTIEENIALFEQMKSGVLPSKRMYHRAKYHFSFVQIKQCSPQPYGRDKANFYPLASVCLLMLPFPLPSNGQRKPNLFEST